VLAENHHGRLESAIPTLPDHLFSAGWQWHESCILQPREREAAMKNNRIAMSFFAGALILAGLFFSASTANAQPRIGIGIGVGVGPGYYAPPPPVVYAPPYPGYVWTAGYYNPYGVWVNGFWGPRYGYGFGRPFVGPRGFGGRAFVGGHGGFRR
jgi:hypothetical protein